MTTETYSDININFNKNTISADFNKSADNESIKNSLRNILLTKKMQRRMLPTFGASLEQLLFEPLDEHTAKKIGSVILNEIKEWENRIEITNISVGIDEEKLSYEINISYNILTTSIQNNTGNIGFVLGG